jgi:hypothetical protein
VELLSDADVAPTTSTSLNNCAGLHVRIGLEFLLDGIEARISS